MMITFLLFFGLATLLVLPLVVGDNSDNSPSRLTFPLEAHYSSF